MKQLLHVLLIIMMYGKNTNALQVGDIYLIPFQQNNKHFTPYFYTYGYIDYVFSYEEFLTFIHAYPTLPSVRLFLCECAFLLHHKEALGDNSLQYSFLYLHDTTEIMGSVFKPEINFCRLILNNNEILLPDYYLEEFQKYKDAK